jgi:hypothetical protein
MAPGREKPLASAMGSCHLYDTISWVVKAGIWPLYGHCSWAFVLEPLDAHRTRLIERTRLAFTPRSLLETPLLLVSELFVAANALVQRAQLRNIKRRVERQAPPPLRSALPVEVRAERAEAVAAR